MANGVLSVVPINRLSLLNLCSTKSHSRHFSALVMRQRVPFRPFTAFALGTEHAESGEVAKPNLYQSNIWDYESILSTTFALEEGCAMQAELLKEEVRGLVLREEEMVLKLELLDDIQHLGLAYHFQEEISNILHSVSTKDSIKSLNGDLHATALAFRLLRSHGFQVSEDVFDGFKDANGDFKSTLHADAKALLSLYEASFLAFDHDSQLDDARNFSTERLNDLLKLPMESCLLQRVPYALDAPLRWRATRLESRRYIDEYETVTRMKPPLLQLAKLDFNLVQSIQQEELKTIIRWWKELGFNKKLSFARDRLIECFFCATIVAAEAHLGLAREGITKTAQLITVIDDVYETHGTLDELELFTSAVSRWDINSIEELPGKFKVWFSALFDTVNEVADMVQEKKALQLLRKSWADQLNAYLVEAKWSSSGYVPTLEEYLSNATISISGHLILLNFLLCSGVKLTNEAVDCWNEYTDLVLSSCRIFRLYNDLGTSSAEVKRGGLTSIQCYMNDKNVCEEDARKSIKKMVTDTWKKMNKEAANCYPFPQCFAAAAVNVAVTAICLYHHGDAFGAPDEEKKAQIESLLFKPLL